MSSSPYSFSNRLFFAVALIVVSIRPLSAGYEPTLDYSVKYSAGTLAYCLRQLKIDKVVVNVRGLPTRKIPATFVVQRDLIKELEKEKIRVASQADYAVDVQIKMPKPPKLDLDIYLIDGSGKRFIDFDFGTPVDDLAELPRLLGLSGKWGQDQPPKPGDSSPLDDLKPNASDLQAAFRNSPASVQSTIARATSNGKFGVEVAVGESPR
ncbi:MAG: hypothetical protein KDA84_20570, partial [Planctomycetaceae bacterium]|nr:hypothetical protein [Planctomycetaceae bacterium]